MVFDERDYVILRLCGLCRYIPVRLQKKFQTHIFEPKVFVTLRNHKLIRMQTNGLSYKLTQDGREVLAEMGFHIQKIQGQQSTRIRITEDSEHHFSTSHYTLQE